MYVEDTLLLIGSANHLHFRLVSHDITTHSLDVNEMRVLYAINSHNWWFYVVILVIVNVWFDVSLLCLC